MLTTLATLRRTQLLSIPGLLRLGEAVQSSGLNLMALLRNTARAHPERMAIVDDHEQLRYGELWRRAEVVAVALHERYGVQAGQRVAIACRNHVAAITSIVASSRLGAQLFLVNPEMSSDQLHALDSRLHVDLVIYDEELAPLMASAPLGRQALPSYHPHAESIAGLAAHYAHTSRRLRRASTGSIVVLTGGTTGQPKTIGRTPSVGNALPALLALLARTRLDTHPSLYLAPPIYHGHGLAMLLIGLSLGTTLYMIRRFDAARACALIDRHQVAAVTLVPLMLQRMLRVNPAALASLRCIIAGSAPLSPTLASEALDRLGPILFNLYGTSEAGFSILATPEILRNKPATIGRPLPGVRTRIVGPNGAVVHGTSVGQLCIQSRWTMSGKGWIRTGDLAYRDAADDLMLCGRVDDMIVSGGENVYPIELENVLLQHPDIAAAIAVGIADAEFGQRLKAVVVAKRGGDLNQAAVLAWLKPRVARYQLPVAVEFRDELPYTALGKPDRKALAM